MCMIRHNWANMSEIWQTIPFLIWECVLVWPCEVFYIKQEKASKVYQRKHTIVASCSCSALNLQLLRYKKNVMSLWIRASTTCSKHNETLYNGDGDGGFSESWTCETVHAMWRSSRGTLALSWQLSTNMPRFPMRRAPVGQLFKSVRLKQQRHDHIRCTWGTEDTWCHNTVVRSAPVILQHYFSIDKLKLIMQR